MSKILTVFGATGSQGGSVIKSIREHPMLSRTYKIRGVTRLLHSAESRRLAAAALRKLALKISSRSGRPITLACAPLENERMTSNAIVIGSLFADPSAQPKKFNSDLLASWRTRDSMSDHDDVSTNAAKISLTVSGRSRPCSMPMHSIPKRRADTEIFFARPSAGDFAGLASA